MRVFQVKWASKPFLYGGNCISNPTDLIQDKADLELRITAAASAPGPQVMPPPGWLPLPHKYSPLIGVW
jgi:hypothetical protein